MTDGAAIAPEAEALEAGRLLFARPFIFLRGGVRIDDLPPMDRLEVAFAGRSNVGKSSLINALAGTSGLARTSNTPGRTQQLNFFDASSAPLRLVDMPGYGFARAPLDQVKTWTRLIHAYLTGRPNLRRVYLLIDARHGIKPHDETVMNELDQAAVSFQAVLTKADKTRSNELAAVEAATLATLRRHPAAHPALIMTSAEKGSGIAELRAVIAALLE